MGSSFFTQSPIHHSQFIPSPCQSVLLNLRNAETKRRRRNRVPMASLREDDPNFAVSNKRRAVLLVGISVLPLLQLRAGAIESLAKKESVSNNLEENHGAELAVGVPPPNPLLPLLNSIGIIGTGVFGALYALIRQEKKDNDATIESMKIKLQEKEADMVSLEKNYESKLQTERQDKSEQLKKAKDEQLVLIDQLNSAKKTITGLGQEVKNEKKLVENFTIQIDGLQNDLLKAAAVKKSLEEEMKNKLDAIESLQEKTKLLGLEIQDREANAQKLTSSLAEKEVELKNLNASYNQTKDAVAKAYSEIEGLKDELRRNEKELELKSSLTDELNVKINSLTAERDNLKKDFGALQTEYNDLKLSSEKKAVADAQLLGERENEIVQLKEKLEVASKDAEGNRAIISNLTEEREHLKGLLNVELSNVKSLKEDLEATQEALGKSRTEASDLSKQVEQLRNLCGELESEVSKVRAEFDIARNELQRRLDAAKQNEDLLLSELKAVKELLRKTTEELQNVTNELTYVTENRDTLVKELVDVQKIAETKANDLKEEKKFVSALNKELQALERKNLKDMEARKSVEIDLEAATKSLDEMNHKALNLARDLDGARSTISNLEDEKMVLYKSLTEEKNAAKEARDNMEDAHKIVLTLGNEIESLEKREKKLEEELAATKGEILRLRSQINSSTLLESNQKQANGEAEAEAKVTVKRTRRRKPTSQ